MEVIELMAEELMKYRTLAEKDGYLRECGKIQHIKTNSMASRILSAEDPERFCNVGSNFYYRKDNDSDRKYRNICKANGEYLYEKYPLIFEFYDEYMNGNSYEENTKNEKVR